MCRNEKNTHKAHTVKFLNLSKVPIQLRRNAFGGKITGEKENLNKICHLK